MFEIILIFVIVILILFYVKLEEKRHKRKYKEFYKLPVPKLYPLIGNSHLLLGTNILNAFDSISKNTGNPCIFYIPNRSYLTSVPEELKIILNHPKSMNKNSAYRFFVEVFGNSLLIAPAHIWKKNRKFLSKGFNQEILNSFVSIFYELSCKLNVILKNKEFYQDDIYHLFEKYTMDTFCEATLGIKSQLLDSKDSEIVRLITNGQKLMTNRVGNLLEMNDFIFNRTKNGRELCSTVKIFNEFVQEIINRKRKLMLEEDYVEEKLKPILDLLLLDKSFDDEYIKEEMGLFAGAATDTTAYSMAYTCCLLGMHQNIQEKVYDEVTQYFGKNDEIDYQNLHVLKYTEMVINEAMRLIPVIPIVGRKACGDIDLGSRVIPEGTDIFLYFLGTHRDEKIYPNPKKFDPDRFLPEEVAKRPPYSFLPFSGGPRNCIGWKYALMAMKTTIANVVRNYIISSKYNTIDDMDFESSIVMSTTHKLDCHFTPR